MAHWLAWALSDFPNLHIQIPYLTDDYSLAQAELYITLATVFSRFTFEIYETHISDVEMDLLLRMFVPVID